MNKELIEKLSKEFVDLDIKANKLYKFINSNDSNTVGFEYYRLLRIQALAMDTYLQALRGRIELLQKDNQKEDESMKVTITIPKEFIEHFNRDKFEDSFERIRNDLDYFLKNGEVILAGNYEIELISMLIEAFKNSKVTED